MFDFRRFRVIRWGGGGGKYNETNFESADVQKTGTTGGDPCESIIPGSR